MHTRESIQVKESIATKKKKKKNYFEQAVNKNRWKIRLCLTIRRARLQSFNKEERQENLSGFNVKLD